ncbi:hypothetical protein GCM10010273_00570 [Streptomyces lavendulocolor]
MGEENLFCGSGHRRKDLRRGVRNARILGFRALRAHKRNGGAPVGVTMTPDPVHLPFTQVAYVRRTTDVERLPG